MFVVLDDEIAFAGFVDQVLLLLLLFPGSLVVLSRFGILGFSVEVFRQFVVLAPRQVLGLQAVCEEGEKGKQQEIPGHNTFDFGALKRALRQGSGKRKVTRI